MNIWLGLLSALRTLFGFQGAYEAHVVIERRNVGSRYAFRSRVDRVLRLSACGRAYGWTVTNRKLTVLYCEITVHVYELPTHFHAVIVGASVGQIRHLSRYLRARFPAQMRGEIVFRQHDPRVSQGLAYEA